MSYFVEVSIAKLEKLVITKEEINRLPLAKFKGSIHLIKSRRSAYKIVAQLKEEALVGFDTETKPSFKKGEVHPPALVQLATRTEVWLFRLWSIGILRALIELFQDPHILKVGLALHDDIKHLQRLEPFEPRGFLDIANLAEEAGLRQRGLRNMAAMLLGIRISKRAQMSNWAKPVLSANQMNYAATDPWVSLLLYREFQKMRVGAKSAGVQ